MLNYDMFRSIFCKNHARERAAIVEFTKIFKRGFMQYFTEKLKSKKYILHYFGLGTIK